MKYNNLPAYVNKYVVLREVNGEYWYWGSWQNIESALRVAHEIGGIVKEAETIEKNGCE